VITLNDLRNATGGQLFGEVYDDQFTGFCSDPSDVEPGYLFVFGESQAASGIYDLETALRNGAAGLLCENSPQVDTTGVTVILVGDIITAMGQWAAYVLRQYNTTVVCTYGRVGAALVRSAIASVLSTEFSAYLPSETGGGRLSLPLAVQQLQPDHQVAVLSLDGKSVEQQQTDIANAQPIVSVITELEPVDRFNLIAGQRQERIARGILHSLPGAGRAVLNFCDPVVRRIREASDAPVATYGWAGSQHELPDDIDVAAVDVNYSLRGNEFSLVVRQQQARAAMTNCLGPHGLSAVLAAITVGALFELPLDNMLEAIAKVPPVYGMLHPILNHRGAAVIDHSEDTTIDSMLQSLDWLSMLEVPGRRIVVMGDLAGTSTSSGQVYQSVSQKLAEVADYAVLKGDVAAAVTPAASHAGMDLNRIHTAYLPNDAASMIDRLAENGDIVLVAGGKKAQMRRVVNALLGRPEGANTSHIVHQPTFGDTWIELDLNALGNNVEIVKRRVRTDVQLMAIVEGNAFGHGLLPVAATALARGVAALAVSTVEEGVQLRMAGISEPILIMNPVRRAMILRAVEYDLQLTISSLETAHLLMITLQEHHLTAQVHLLVDVGFGMFGLLPEQVPGQVRQLTRTDSIEIVGLYTYLPLAEDLLEAARTREQLAVFSKTLASLKAAGIQLPFVHAANSAAILTVPESHHNTVRIGSVMYGLNPSLTITPPAGLKPVLSWKTTVTQIKILPEGWGVGGGSLYKASPDEAVAIIPVGYFDGLPSGRRDWGEVLIRGRKAPLIGRVSSWAAAVGISHIPEVQVGDEVVLLGKQGELQIPVEDVAHRLDVSIYDLLASLPASIPRVVVNNVNKPG